MFAIYPDKKGLLHVNLTKKTLQKFIILLLGMGNYSLKKLNIYLCRFQNTNLHLNLSPSSTFPPPKKKVVLMHFEILQTKNANQKQGDVKIIV